MSDVPAVRPTASLGEAEPAPVILVRLLPGQVGESQRVVHVVPVVGTTAPTVLVARCGARIYPATAEQLPRLYGMPCERCLLATPTP